MEKIKPEVIGYKIIYSDMSPSIFKWGISELQLLCSKELHPSLIHENGKPKFRPIYKRDIK